MQLRLVILALVTAVLVAPAATATWRAHGTYEPDTIWDAQDGYMFAEPDTSPDEDLKQVYFNAVGNSYITSVNPNSDVLGSRIRQPHTQLWGAYLGVWKDCNGDGYIGAAAGAMSEYRSELLLDTTICPADGGYQSGGWVYEFRWIHPDVGSTTLGIVAAGIEDNDAAVWGDFGLPGRDALDIPECEIASFDTIGQAVTDPYRGSFAHTGLMIAYLDCFNGHNVAGTINTLDATGLLAFEDPEHPEDSSSLLNQHLPVNVFGDPNAPEGHREGLYDTDGDGAAFTVFDCGDGPDPVTGGGVLAPRINDPAGNYHASLVNVANGAPAVALPVGPPTGGKACGPGGTTLDVLLISPNPEGGPRRDFDGQSRHANDMAFSFNDNGLSGVTGGSLTGIPSGAGLDQFRFQFLLGPSWIAHGPEASRPQLLDRNSIEPAGAAYVTFYAKLGESIGAANLVIPGVAGVYGAEWCQGLAVGVVHKFDCNPANWYDPSIDPFVGVNQDFDGNGKADGQVPGTLFHLRDIDCFDGSLVRGVPVYASLVAASAEGACLDAPTSG